jgi:type II secretory pathway component PulC
LNNQSKLIQKALLEEFESNSTDPDPLINELDTDNQTSSDAYDITETMKGFIDLYDLYNLQVLAILTGDDVESVAVIKNPKNNETRQYYEGDSIRGAIVLQILSNKVIVRWNDHKIELVLIERPKIKRVESLSERRKRRLESLVIQPEKKIQKKVLREDVKAFHSDRNFLRDAELTPIINGDKFEGVKITGVVPGSFFTGYETL